MVRPPAVPPEEKVRIVLSILAGEMTVAEAARRAKVSEQSVGNWKRQFLESGRAGLAAGRSGPSSREQQLDAQVADLTRDSICWDMEGGGGWYFGCEAAGVLWGWGCMGLEAQGRCLVG
ncbi:transposase [Streptomyces sp. NPDC088354]|uniref:transposase n=1 Tax=Streptomyces sp. NPDC088354 TaxID=3365856 RepID=UPI003822A79C